MLLKLASDRDVEVRTAAKPAGKYVKCGEMSDISLEELQDLGVRCKAMRSYLWFKHFVEVGPLDVAAHFLGKCWKRDSDLPETWSELRAQLDAAMAERGN